jgi:hypothetical protein
MPREWIQIGRINISEQIRIKGALFCLPIHRFTLRLIAKLMRLKLIIVPGRY